MTIAEWDALYRQTNKRKQMHLTFSDGTILLNDSLVLEQMSLEESLCSEENLRYGCCESSCFQVRIANNEKSFEGQYVNVVQTFPEETSVIVGSDESYIVGSDDSVLQGYELDYAEFGTFRVISDIPTGDRMYRDLICYDKMYDIIHTNVIQWFETLTFPMTVKDFRDSFFDYLRIEQIDVDLINDDFEIPGEIYISDELSGRTVIESICEFNASFGHITRDGKFEYITLPSADSLTYPHYINGTCAYEDYTTDEITGVVAINVSGDAGTKVGEEGNAYLMQSNILTYGAEGTEDLEDALTNILEVISEFTYIPYKVTTYGNPMLPIGTNVTFTTKYKTINSFVMTRFLTGIQGLRDNFSALGDKKYPEDVNRVKNEIQRSAGVTHKLTNEVDQLTSEIYDDQGRSLIQQALDETVIKIDRNGKLVEAKLGVDADLGSLFSINADFIDIQSKTIKFNNEGYSVAGDVFKTIIKPDNFNVQANYPTDHFFADTIPGYYYDISKNIQTRYMGYNGYFLTKLGYQKEFSPDHDPRERYYDVYKEVSTSSNNCILLSSPQTNSWDGGYWATSGIHNFRHDKDGAAYTHYAIIGQHNVLFPSAWANLIADGATVDSDGYLVMPDNDKTLQYYMADDGFNHHISLGLHGLNENDTEHIGFVKVHHEDFRTDIPGISYDEIDYYGEDYLFAVQPSMTISEEDLYDFSGYYWGKTTVARPSLKGTINALQVQSSSDKRLKRDIKEVDNKLIKAICDCPTYQFKFYNEDVTTVGIIAQDFVEACKKYGIDPDGYSLCQKRTVKDNDDTEYYYIEYSQYLTLKSIHLQNQIDELKELIKDKE